MERVLEQLSAPVARAAGGGWTVAVPSEKRGEILVHLVAGPERVRMRAFVIRAPDRAHEEVYRRLLRKNLGARGWRFALDDAGDVYAAADAPLEGLTVEHLEGLLGGLAVLVDEVYEGVFRTGFDVPDSMRVGPPPDAT